MKTIGCTKGFEVLVDDEDFDALSVFSWYAHSNRGHARPARVAFLYHFILPPKPGFVIDHINGDPFDNRRANLRYATPSENKRNRRKSDSFANPFKGVQPAGKSWQARCDLDGQSFYLGVFPTAEEAARAYDEAALRLHGRFARLNFPVAA